MRLLKNLATNSQKRNAAYHNKVPNLLMTSESERIIAKKLKRVLQTRESHFKKLATTSSFFRRLLSERKPLEVYTRKGIKTYQLLTNGLTEKLSELNIVVVLDAWGRAILFGTNEKKRSPIEPAFWTPLQGVTEKGEIISLNSSPSVKRELEAVAEHI